MANQDGMRYNEAMHGLYTILFIAVACLLCVVASIIPRRARLSVFELERRKGRGDVSAKEELRREALFEEMISYQRVLEALLLVISVITSVGAFGIIIGAASSLLLALFYGRIARFGIVHVWSQRIYDQYEESLLSFAERTPQVGKLLRTVVSSQDDTITISSREEIAHVIKHSNGILKEDEKKLLLNGLDFGNKLVETAMTPRGVIETVKKSDVVGPLLLDELHRTGHSRFPVIDTSLDHIVGILHIRELLTLNDKKTLTANDVMDNKVFYINQEQSLEHALAAFIKTHRQLFVVVNGYRETVGLLTLEDCIEALVGRKIVDQFDVYDDLRVVAERSAKFNNNPPNATNV